MGHFNLLGNGSQVFSGIKLCTMYYAAPEQVMGCKVKKLSALTPLGEVF